MCTGFFNAVLFLHQPYYTNIVQKVKIKNLLLVAQRRSQLIECNQPIEEPGYRRDPGVDSRTFLGISECNRSRSTCTLEDFLLQREKLENFRGLRDYPSSSSSEEGSMEYMMELQTQLERLRMEKLSLLRSNCNANKKISEMKKERSGLAKHLETAKRQVGIKISCFFLSYSDRFSNQIV